NVFKRSYNQCLDLLSGQPIGTWSWSEAVLAQELDVSRTTVRGILAGLTRSGILPPDSERRRTLRHATPSDYFPEPQTESVAEIVERTFMHMVSKGDYHPGQVISGAELARQSGTSTTAVREYLTRFSRFGLLERRSSGGWTFNGLSADFAVEIYEIREMFELRSARSFVALPNDAPAWRELDAIEHAHRDLLQAMDARFNDFPQLDERLHRLILNASENRFMREFYDVISVVFHYHYQWDKHDEKQRNTVAAQEHLDYIAALRSRDVRLTVASCKAHMRTARRTLLSSLASSAEVPDRW
ncbi:MAG: FCD domain-containing protein, partial [Lysobacteraceae bacterium]